MKRQEMQDDFLLGLQKWLPAILDYALAINNPAGGLRHALKDIPPDPRDDVSDTMGDPHGKHNYYHYSHNYYNRVEWELLSALRSLGFFLTLRKRGGAKEIEYDIPYILRIFPVSTWMNVSYHMHLGNFFRVALHIKNALTVEIIYHISSSYAIQTLNCHHSTSLPLNKNL